MKWQARRKSRTRDFEKGQRVGCTRTQNAIFKHANRKVDATTCTALRLCSLRLAWCRAASSSRLADVALAKLSSSCLTTARFSASSSLSCCCLRCNAPRAAATARDVPWSKMGALEVLPLLFLPLYRLLLPRSRASLRLLGILSNPASLP